MQLHLAESALAIPKRGRGGALGNHLQAIVPGALAERAEAPERVLIEGDQFGGSNARKLCPNLKCSAENREQQRGAEVMNASFVPHY